MTKLINSLIEERRVTLFLAAIIAIGGLVSFYLLPKQENPSVDAPMAMVITPFPGAEASDVDELVSKKIEEELSQIDYYDKSRTISKESVSIVIVNIQPEAPDYDRVYQDIRNRMADVGADLPSGTMASTIQTDFMETSGIVISLSGENYTYDQLESFGEQFKDNLLDVEGVSKFNVEGKVDKEVKVEVDIAKLNQLNLSLNEINDLLMVQNLEIPSGSLDTPDGKVAVKTPGIYGSISDIENVIIGISPETGIVTRLKDIADVNVQTEEGVPKYKLNGNNAILLTGYFEAGKNVVIIGDEVRGIIDDVKAELPEDLIVEEIVYQPQDVSNSTNDFVVNLIAGIILVIIVVFLGMGFRNAIVASTAIPLSILITFIAMYFGKIEIHQMSLTALIIALGVLVDNAIVISDGVQKYIDEGLDNESAAKKAAKESVAPIFAATLTTIAAFFPLMGLPEPAGSFMIAVPLVLTISILAAFVVALFVMPAMSVIFFRPAKKKVTKKSRIRNFFEKTLVFGLKRKGVTLIAMVGLLIVTVSVLMPMLPSQFFPYADKDLIYIDVETEVSGNIDETEILVDEVGALLMTQPEVTAYTQSVGTGLPKFYMTLPVPIPSVDSGQVLIKYDLEAEGQTRFESREAFAQHLQQLCDQKIAGGKVKVNLLALNSPEPKVQVRLSGDNVTLLKEAKEELVQEMSQLEGITAISDDMKDDTYQLEIIVDDDKATNMGVTKYDIQSQINAALYGSTATVYRKNGNEYDVLVQSNIEDVALLENMAIKSSITGNKVPLKQFAKIEAVSKMDTVGRYNRKKAVTIQAEALVGYSPVDLENQIENEILPKMNLNGIQVAFDGERELMETSFSVIGILAVVAIAIIYIILLIQFNSFVQPLVILATVPLSLIGSIIGLVLCQQPLSLTAFFGIIALIGLVVKNGILLIEYINEAKNNGHSIQEACIDAVDKRFSPIMLGAATTILGLLPLAVSGSDLFAPMAVALMSGLALATFLTMIIIPVLYSLIEGRKEKQA